MSLERHVEWVPRFFEGNRKNISRILPARGCRELWLQGQIFLHLYGTGAQTNATSKRFDLYKTDCFVLEIKLLGGDYQRKVLDLLRDDFDKLCRHEGLEERYMLLVLDNTYSDTSLYRDLSNFEHSSGEVVFKQNYDAFSVILWAI